MGYDLSVIAATTVKWGICGGVVGGGVGLVVSPWAGLVTGILGIAFAEAANGHDPRNLDVGGRLFMSTVTTIPSICGLGGMVAVGTIALVVEVARQTFF